MLPVSGSVLPTGSARPLYGHPLWLDLDAVDLGDELVESLVHVLVDEDVVKHVPKPVFHLPRSLDDVPQIIVLQYTQVH